MTPLRTALIREIKLRGYSARTEKAYVFWIRSLAEYYGRSPDLLSEKDLENYVIYLSTKKQLSVSSCHQAICAIVFFYQNVLSRKITTRLVAPKMKKPSKIPILLTRAEVVKVIHSCPSLKYNTILKMAYTTGMRLSELCCVQWHDLDWERQLIKVVQGKGFKDRYVLFPDSLKQAVKAYQSDYRSDRYIFTGKTSHQPLSDSSIQRQTKKAVVAAKINKPASVHSLRHAFASHQLESGMTLPRLQQLMGHRQLTSTLRYVHWLPHLQRDKGVDIDLLNGLEV